MSLRLRTKQYLKLGQGDGSVGSPLKACGVLPQRLMQVIHLVLDVVAAETITRLLHFAVKLPCFDSAGVLVLARFQYVMDSIGQGGSSFALYCWFNGWLCFGGQCLRRC